MAYRDKIAEKRTAPTVTVEDFNAPLGQAANYERMASGSMKARTVSTAPNPSQSTGNQVRVQGNTKGTGVAGRPLNGYRKTVGSASENPDGAANRGGSPAEPKAAKR